MSSPLPARSSDELDLAAYLREEAIEPAAAEAEGPHASFAALTLGAIGVVYGDIGTSPLYALREALRATGASPGPAEVLGVLSLLVWAIVLIVTVKYVLFLLRIDNRGEGGILALYTMLRLAIGHRSVPVLMLALIGAALFFGDATITPAISVMSAMEGLALYAPQFHGWIVPLTLGILVALFVVQSRGTGAISRFFGPITLLWFLVLAGLGLMHIREAPQVLAALDPLHGIGFLLDHPGIAFAVLGAVFLAVTGAEALYADLGHFGRGPIMAAWFALIFPALVLNYLGQGAMVLAHPAAAENPLFLMVPRALLPWFIGLATAATVIAAQAVITGAFSIARAAMQLGLLPRMRITHTSSQHHGQIYVPAVNWLLLVAVVWLVVSVGSSEALASAYGIAVTGTMIVTSLLAILFILRGPRRLNYVTLPLALLLLSIECVFLASNLTKILDGGYIPLLIGGGVGVCMWAWWRGTQKLLRKAHGGSVALGSFVNMMKDSSVHRVPGTAFFLTADPEVVPSTLLHNIKNNGVLHAQTVILTVETLRVPLAPEEQRVSLEPLGGAFSLLTLRFGFMETPKVVRALVHARARGVRFDTTRTIFFVARRRPVVAGAAGLERAWDRLHALMHRFAADPSDYFHLPRDRVIELGERVSL